MVVKIRAIVPLSYLTPVAVGYKWTGYVIWGYKQYPAYDFGSISVCIVRMFQYIFRKEVTANAQLMNISVA